MERSKKGLIFFSVIYLLLALFVLLRFTEIVVVGIALEIILLAVILTKKIGYDVHDIGLVGKMNLQEDLIIPLIIVFSISVVVYASAYFKITVSHSLLYYLILLVYYTFYVGLFEETLFRGLLYTALEERWNEKVAIIGSSILFAILHLNNMFFPLIFGFITATYRAKYKKILGLVLAHGLIDTIGKLFIAEQYSIIVYVVGLIVIGIVLSIYFYRGVQRE